VKEIGPGLQALQKAFGERVQVNAPLADLVTVHAGGNAIALLAVQSRSELAQAARLLWEHGTPFFILGNGSNVLISDTGFEGIVLVNKARRIEFISDQGSPAMWVDSGTNLGTAARQAGLKGLSGLEWAAAIPGTVGGAVYGNAGAHGRDIHDNLILAEILHPVRGEESWTCAQMEYGYRTSGLKKLAEKCVILAALLRLTPGDPEEIDRLMDEYAQRRRRTQPPGASMGSIFKNPAGDRAGRLIEAAGLKGYRIGGAQVSTVHANFFVNDDGASALDIWNLIQKVRATVQDRFGVTLESEIELIGSWPAQS